MPSNAELYAYYCRRSACRPNSRVTKLLEAQGDTPLETLDVSENYLGQRGLTPLLDLVKNTKTIHTLNVSNNAMTTEQVQHLAYCLALHPCIKTVLLNNAGLDDTHVDPLLQLLTMNSSIEQLQVEKGNQFSPATLRKFSSALAHNAQVCMARRAEQESHEAYVKQRASVARSFTANVVDNIPAALSGGYVHFATWWKNPQYSLRISRSSRVAFTLNCLHDDVAANQMGLLVLRHDGVHRAIELTAATTIVAESAVSDRHCEVEAELDSTEHYVVMPFTFNPGRALRFSLTATLVNAHTAQEEGWLTLERLDPRYDWCTRTIEAAWTPANAGGSGSYTTWRRNDMYRVCAGHTAGETKNKSSNSNSNSNGSGSGGGSTTTTTTVAEALTNTAAAGAGAAAGKSGEEVVMVYVLLMKEADPYVNDEREIGIDIVRPDVHNRSAPPLMYAPEVVCASRPHAQTTFALLKVELPLSQLDVYVVPSTAVSGQTGSYTLTIFSSISVDVTRSSFPHGWRYRVLEGVWDEMSCGGCRAECPSWKNNPSIEVAVEDAARPLIACVELRESTAPFSEVTTEDTDLAETKKENDMDEEDAAAVQRRAELVAFQQRHRSSTVEVGVMAVEPVPPTYATLATSAQFPHAASLVIVPTRTTHLYVVPMLRRAAEVGAFTLELFSESPFVIVKDAVVCLAARERSAQLQAYQLESERRAALTAEAMRQLGSQRRSGATGNGGRTNSRSGGAADLADLAEVRRVIEERCAATGLPYADRDFPRGVSLLFLDPAGPPPFDFPVETTWRRVSDIMRDRTTTTTTTASQTSVTSPNDLTVAAAAAAVDALAMTPPNPYGPRHWFASVLQAVAAKPGWLSRIFSLYNPANGFAQFAYFKQDAWVGVTVDDFLLVDNQNDLVYGRSAGGGDDFFFSLAEKAYAKLHRCYAALEPTVSPDQTLLELLAQGLMDVTGGVVSTMRTRQENGTELPDDDKEKLWRLLKRAIEPNLLCAFVLESQSNSNSSNGKSKASSANFTRERTHVGLLADRLYGVMDARFVEQQRLVKLRLYDATEDADAVWKGKWAFDSPLWTPTLREVLHYHSPEPYAAWVHVDELFYYFTRLLLTEVCPTVATIPGSFAESTEQDPPETDVSLRNPQFALNVQMTDTINELTAGAEARAAVVELHIGLHRRDPRLDITRAKGATARLRPLLGFAVFATEDNSRRLTHIADEAQQLLRLVKPSAQRDEYVTVPVTAEFLQSHRLTVMPFRENLRDADAAYTLSVSCSSAPRNTTAINKDSSSTDRCSIGHHHDNNKMKETCSDGGDGVRNGCVLQWQHVAPNTVTRIAGRWGDGAKAGTPDAPQWRNNPQFFLSASEEAEVTIALRPSTTTTALLGFTLHRTRQCRSFLKFDATTVVASASATIAGGAVPRCVVRLAGMAERRGMPYVLVPYSSEDAGSFEVDVVSNKPVQLRVIDPRLDWHRASATVSINADSGNTGGNPSFPSWRFNTQLAITLPVEREGRLFISAKRLRSADPRVKIGMLLLRSGTASAGSYRRRLTYSDSAAAVGDEAVSTGIRREQNSNCRDSGNGDVVARSVDGALESVLETDVSLPRDRGALILVVYADQPYKEAEVELSFYCAANIDVQPVSEWPAVAVREGSWELGTTAAGSRVNFASWINNPFFGLTVLRPTTVTLLLVQYPRDHEHPIVKRHGTQKALLPPPLVHPDRCTEIQLSVAQYDATLTEVASTVPTTRAETYLTLELSPEHSYFVVPCTTEPQHDGDFKLFAFADHPIDLFETEKPRLPYV